MPEQTRCRPRRLRSPFDDDETPRGRVERDRTRFGHRNAAGDEHHEEPPRRRRRDREDFNDDEHQPTGRLDRRLRRDAAWERQRSRERAADEADVAQSTCVLVAEDEPALLSLLTTALRRRGFSVVEARSGRELWAKARAALEGTGQTRPIDLIVADVELTDLPTLDALAAIRRLDGALPVILTTAVDEVTIAADAHALGADVVFGKPFAIDDLVARVVELCS
jgi:CheY-like chemotaxis protein